MKLLVISAFAAALLAGTVTVLRSQTPVTDRPVAAGISVQDLQTTALVNKLPVEHFDDQLVVYSK
jgi:hypothetical protein